MQEEEEEEQDGHQWPHPIRHVQLQIASKTKLQLTTIRILTLIIWVLADGQQPYPHKLSLTQ